MPKNKTQGIIFGIIMSYSMAVGMEIYNNAIQQGVHLQPGGFTNLTYGIVGKALVEALTIPVLGIGAGVDVDCQVLVSYDLLGMYNGFKPKFVKHFANIRQQMVAGLNQFHEESVAGTFPDESTSFNKPVEIPKLY